ncbi:hypothetical protein CFRS1_v003885 [Colletotrichum fructicola]|nr:hypothetical protein CFRS1_v003885 [Colletotrichum fructicola]
MAYPFSEEEKRLILAEVIKTSNLDLGHLVDFLKLHKTEPNWLKMQLPPGRTMEQCIQVTEQMFQGPMRIPDLKRKPVGDLLDKPSKRLAVASPMEPPAQLPPLASASQGPSAYANPMSHLHLAIQLGKVPAPRQRAQPTVYHQALPRRQLASHQGRNAGDLGQRKRAYQSYRALIPIESTNLGHCQIHTQSASNFQNRRKNEPYHILGI